MIFKFISDDCSCAGDNVYRMTRITLVYRFNSPEELTKARTAAKKKSSTEQYLQKQNLYIALIDNIASCWKMKRF